MGSHSSSHFPAALCYTVSSGCLSQAGALSSRVFPGAEACLSCDPVILLRCRDVTDGFDTSSTRGSVNSFFSGASPEWFPLLFRAWPSPGMASVCVAHHTTNVSVPCRRCVACSRGRSLAVGGSGAEQMPPVHTTLQGIGRPESQEAPRTLIGQNITGSHISFSGCHRHAAPEVDDPLLPYFVA